jgi:hypothetical protein
MLALGVFTVVVVNRQMPWDGLSWGRMCARGFGRGFGNQKRYRFVLQNLAKG